MISKLFLSKQEASNTTRLFDKIRNDAVEKKTYEL